jgi:hypothetical protein
MKRSASIILVLGVTLALLAYLGGYFAGTARHRAMLRSDVPELAWLREEFKLTNAEFQRITELHEAYLPECGERCARIDAKNNELRQLIAQAGAVTPEIERKLAEAAALRLECEKAMLAHFLAVSKAMPPQQGQRYLAWIEQRTFMPEHRMAGHQP